MGCVKENFDEVINGFNSLISSLQRAANDEKDIAKEVRETPKPDSPVIYPESEGHKEALHGAIFEGDKRGDTNLVDQAKSLLSEEEQDKVIKNLGTNYLNEFMSNLIKGVSK